MSNGERARTLFVRPIESADLAFGSAGILAGRGSSAWLGKSVTAFDSDALLARLSATDDTGQLRYDASAITGELRPSALFVLRNGESAAMLDQSIAQHMNAYIERYKHMRAIADRAKKLFGRAPTDPIGDPSEVTTSRPASKVGQVEALRRTLALQFQLIGDAYGGAAALTRDGVSKSVTATTTPEGKYASTTTTHQGTRKEKHPVVKVTDDDNDLLYTLPEHQVEQAQETPDTQDTVTEFTPANKYRQITETPYRDIQHPALDNVAQFLKAELDLRDEELTEFAVALKSENLYEILANELRMLTLDVRRLQIAFMQTFLVSPISGTVTNVYKDVGESVTGNEPVVRIERDDEVLLVGRIRYRGPLRVGATARITTTDLFDAGEALVIDGASVVSVRGHDADSDEWDVVMQCRNPVKNGKKVLPLNYHFDRDDTQIEITAT